MTTTSTDTTLAWAYLAQLAEPPAYELWRFIRESGPTASCAQAAMERIQTGDVPADLAQQLGKPRSSTVDWARRALADADRAGAWLIHPGHPEWPDALAMLPGTRHDRFAELAPPIALWVRGRGNLAQLTRQACAVVGARAATTYGTRAAQTIGAWMAGHGHTTVSGGALGVDGAAHRGVLAQNGPTIAVLPSGIDRPYPYAHARLFDHIAEAGLLVSEYAPGDSPGRDRFLARNRLVAVLAPTGTVVVEALLRSGSMHTARIAAEIGRPLYAVPGPIDSATSAGCHRLIQDRTARLLADPRDLTEGIPW